MTDIQVKNKLDNMNTTAQMVKLGKLVTDQGAAISALNTAAEGIPTVVKYTLKAADLANSGATADVSVTKAITTLVSANVDSSGTYKPVLGYSLSTNKKTITLTADADSKYAADDVVTLCYL